VIIKCVGFHTNAANERILQGKKDFRAVGLIDDQLWAVLEGHLDHSTFNLPFGSSYLNGVYFNARLIAKGWNEPELMAKMLTTPINATVTHFTSTNQFDSIQAVQAVAPEVGDMLHEQVVMIRNRFNDALTFKEYLDRNEVMWDEYHQMLYPRAKLFNARRKPQLPWVFRELEQVVEDEWREYNLKMDAKKSQTAEVTVS